MHGLDFAELLSRPILKVLLVELEEGHDFVQVETLVQVVVQSGSEVVDGEVAQAHAVALAEVDEVGSRVDLVPLEAVQVVFAQEARIDG